MHRPCRSTFLNWVQKNLSWKNLCRENLEQHGFLIVMPSLYYVKKSWRNFELHDFFLSPKNVHLKALLYWLGSSKPMFFSGTYTKTLEILKKEPDHLDHSRSKQSTDQRVLVSNSLPLKNCCFPRKKKLPKIFLTFVYLYSMQLFSADPTIFSKKI